MVVARQRRSLGANTVPNEGSAGSDSWAMPVLTIYAFAICAVPPIPRGLDLVATLLRYNLVAVIQCARALKWC
jgi:hypothetical protein